LVDFLKLLKLIPATKKKGQLNNKKAPTEA